MGATTMGFGESVGADMFGTMLNWGLNEFSASEAHRRQKETIKYQNDLQRENWHMQNAYNNPVQQRKRLAAAGLNPDLMYGGGAGALQAGPVGSTPSPSAPQAHTSQGINGAAAVAQQNQQAKTDSEIDLNEALAEEARKRAGKEGVETDILQKDLDNYNDRLEAYLESLNAGSDKDRAAAEEARQNGKRLTELTKLTIEQTATEVQRRNTLKSEENRNNAAANLDKIKYQWYGSEARARIKRDLAAANLDNTQAMDIVETFLFRVGELAARADMEDSQKLLNKSLTDINEFALKMNMKFEEIERWEKIIIEGLEEVRKYLRLPAENLRDLGVGIGSAAKIATAGLGK